MSAETPEPDSDVAEDGLAAAPEPWSPEDEDREPTSTLALFDGDAGRLELPQRRVLVYLLKQRFLSAQTHPREWRALVENPAPIRSRLHDMFLDLHLDTEREVAYKRPVTPEAGGQPFPTLLYDAPWGREETLVLVYLRSRYRSEQAAGAERVFVDVEDIHEHVASYRPGHATDVAGDARRATRAIESIYKAGLLIGPAGGDRFQVSDAIEPLLPLTTLQSLLAWLRSQNSGQDDVSGAAEVESVEDAATEPGSGVPR